MSTTTTNTTTTNRAPAGWYADPASMTPAGEATRRRWWDGAAWTQHTAPLETPLGPVAETRAAAVGYSSVSSAPVTVSPRDSARAAESMSLHPVGPASGGVHGAASPAASGASSPVSPANAEVGGYEPFSHRRRSEMVERSHHGRNPLGLRVHTVSIWLMATMPLTQALLVFWVFTSLPAESSSWTRALAVAFPLVLSAALAGQDTRLMELSGHLRTAPWITALLAPPVYLAVRGVRVARTTGARSWPLIVWAATQLGVLAAWWLIDPSSVAAVLRALL